MNLRFPLLLVATCALGLGGCASSSIERTWKAPGQPGEPVQKIAVLAVEDGGLVRLNFEQRFVRDLARQGQAAMTTYDFLGLPEI